jgi:hypothetical protein
MTAVNSSTQTNSNAVALSDLEEIDGADAEGIKGRRCDRALIDPP